MADDQASEATEGTILRGADGSVYFVPTDDLAGYRLEGEEAQAAIDASTDDVSGFSFTPESATDDPTISGGFISPIFQRLKITDTSGGGGNYQYQKYRA